MSNYRKEINEIAIETRWTFFRFLSIFIIIVITLFALFFGLRSIGLIGSTTVERKIFEQSYQRNEALKSALLIFEAQLLEIDQKLKNPNLDENTRFNLNAQKSALNLRINSTKGNMK